MSTTTQPAARAVPKDEHGDRLATYTFWLMVCTAALVVATLVVAAATVGLWLYAGRQAADMEKSIAAAEDSAKTARDALVKTQRAFVYIATFEYAGLGSDAAITPVWRNSGTTPTRSMRNYTNWKSFNGEPPASFGFPDQDKDGNSVTDSGPFTQPAFIGPGETMAAQSMVIPLDLLNAAAAGRMRIFVWGWSKYQDVFGTKHILRFCNEVRVKALSSEGKLAISFPIYQRNNCTDEDCGSAG
jgi:hypothetical protein